MSSYLTFFPPVQNFKFSPYGQNLAAKYNFRHIDDGSHDQLILPGQLKKYWAQKVQYTDHSQLCYILSTASSITAELFDGNGIKIEDLTVTDTGVPYDYKHSNGNTYNTNVFLVNVLFNTIDHPEGHYYILVTSVYEAGELPVIEKFRSEPIWLRAKHKGTILLEATHGKNDFDVLFNSSFNSPVFRLRIDSTFMYMEPASDDVVFTDQDDDIRKLYGNPYRIWKLRLGSNTRGASGMPEYLVDKVNRILCLDKFKIEGKRFIKHEGTKLEQSRYDTYPLQNITIQLREWKNDDAGAFPYNTVTIFTSPGTYPYTWPSFTFGDGFNNFYYPTVIMEDSGYEDTKITEIVALIEAELGTTGVFDWTGGVLSYENGDGEGYNNSIIPVFTKHLDCTVSVPAAGTLEIIQKNGQSIIDWGDLSAYTYTVSAYNITRNIYHAYTSITSSLRIFHDDLITDLHFNQAWNSTQNISLPKDPLPRVSAITGNASAATKTFGVLWQDFGGNAIDLSFLYPARAVFTSLYAGIANIGGVVPGWASGFTPITWPVFRYADFSRNVFTSSEVDDFINEMYNSVIYKPGGTLLFKYQTPSAPPTGASATARGLLTSSSANWTIITD